MALAASLSFIPVVAFLFGLNALDTYKLLTFRRVLLAVAAGCVAALFCYPLNTFGFVRLGPAHAIFGAPVIEEIAKAAYVLWMVARFRVGFPVDAAVTGFAGGAGFALVENLVYLYQLPPLDSAMVWVVRGLGTAMMHGATTAIVGVVAVTVAARSWLGRVAGTLAALAVAIGIHGIYNWGALPPLERTAVVLLTLPALLGVVFWQSERTLAAWLHGKLDLDIALLRLIDSGDFGTSPQGRYLAFARGGVSAGSRRRHDVPGSLVGGIERQVQGRFVAR